MFYYGFGSFWPIVVLVVLIIIILRHGSRIKRLERVLKISSPEARPQGSAPEVSPQMPGRIIPPPLTPIGGSSNVYAPTGGERFAAWAKEDWLLKLGALLILIGLGWFASYAFIHNWIGEMGRIAIGLIIGALFLILGWWRMRRYVHQGGIFLVLGSTTILLTLWAARELYDFFTPATALGLMFLSTAFVALASVRYHTKSLAFLGVILAGIAPLLTNAPTDNYPALFAYLFVVTLGSLWIVAITGWRELTLASLVLIGLYSLPHLTGQETADRDFLLLAAYAFSIVFFIANTAAIIKNKAGKLKADLITAAGLGLFLLAWILTAAAPEWQSLIIAIWMVVFTVSAFAIYRLTGRREPFYAYAGVGLAMLAAATAAELEGPALTIAYAIESAVVTLLTFTLVGREAAARLSLILIGPILLSFESMGAAVWRASIVHQHFFVLLIMGISLLLTGLVFVRRKDESVAGEAEQPNYGSWWISLGSVYFYILLWLSLHSAAAFGDNFVGTLIALLAYTIVGLITYTSGRLSDNRTLTGYGGALLVFVVGRLLLIDIWKMALGGRIVTFILIGALLASTAFIGRKKKLPEQI